MAKKYTGPVKTEKVASIFGDVKGEQFGGKSNYLQMEVGEVVHGITHAGIDKKVDLGGGNDPVDIPLGILANTEDKIRMMASAVFRSNIIKAKLKDGDIYSVARLPTVKKKAGKGKGKEMDVYAILVTKRK